MQGGEAAVFLIVMFAGFFAMVFGIVYLKTRQNLSMIEKGMNPKQFANRPAPYKNLKWALLLIGAGVGLFLAYILDAYILQTTIKEIYQGNTYYHHDDGIAAIYFSLIAIGGGLGLLGSYKMEKKWWDENKNDS
jgi:hypothetical protein